jgi:hypothetical protein
MKFDIVLIYLCLLSNCEFNISWKIQYAKMQALANDIFLIVNLFSQTQTNLCADLFSNPNQVYFQFLDGD